QIAQAAADLARDSRAATVSYATSKAEKPAPKTPVEKPQPKPANAREPNSDLKPVELAPSTPPSPQFTHANDDRQKDYRALQQMVHRHGSRAIYWTVAILSLAWVAGAMVMGSMLFSPPLWEVRSISQLVPSPGLVGLTVAFVLPVIRFRGFGVMLRRAQDMRATPPSM